MTTGQKDKTILLVEDEGIIALAETQTLQKYGYTVITASNGENAVKAFASTPDIDLVLMDINLGSGMDGTQAAEIILAQRDLPLIFLSSHTERDVVEKTDGITSYGYVVKGSGETVLIASIKMAFRLFEARQKERQKDEALQLSERQLKLITDTMPAYVAYVGMDDLRYRFVNNKFEESYKLPREQIIGAHIKDIIGQENYEFAQKYLDMVRQGQPASYENSFVTAGTERWVNVNYVPEINGQGEVEAVVVLSFDNTDRKRMENRLKESEERLRLIFDTMTEGVALNEIIYNERGEMVDYRVLEVNRAFYRVADFQGDQVIGSLATKLYAMNSDFIKAFWEEHRHKDTTVYTEMFSPLSGKWYAIATSPFIENKFVTSFVEITERKQAEQALQASEDRYRNLFSSIDEGVIINEIVLDQNGEAIDYLILEANRALNKHSLYTMQDVIGKRATDLYQMTPEFIRDWWKEHSQKKEAVHTEYYYAPKDRWFSIVTTPPENGRFATIFTDITERKQAEKQLSFQASLLDIVEQAVIVTDLEGRIVYWNPFAEKLYGWSAAEALGKTTIELIASERPRQGAEIMAQLQTGRSWSGEYQAHRRDGTSFHIQETLSPSYNAQGELTHIIGFSADITERKQANETLIESEAAFRGYFNMGTVGMCVTSPEKGWIEVNNCLCNMLGYTRGELVHKTWAEMTHPDDLKADTMLFDQVMAGKRDAYELGKRFIRKDGKVIHTLLYATCQRNPDGTVKHFLASLVDITKQKEAEIALRENANWYETILQTTLDGFWVASTQGQLLEVNKTYCQMSGYSQQELLSMKISDLDAVENHADTALHIQKVIEQGYDRFESRHRRKDGSVFNVEISAHYHHSKGGRFMVFVRDISKRKSAEESLSELHERLELATRAAHLGVWDWDIKNDVLVWDDRMIALYGIKREDFSGGYSAWLNGVHPEDRASSDEFVLQARRNGGYFDTEFRVIWPDGSIHFLKAHGQIIFGEDGSPQRMTGINYDITGQKQVEQALQKSEARLKVFFEHANDAIHISNANGELIEVNQRMCELMGYSREQLLKMRVSDLQAPERRISSKVIQTEIAQYGNSLFEGVNIHRDGRRFPVEISIAQFDGPQGDLFISILRDITERQQADMLLENQKLLQDIIDNTPALVYILDTEGRFILANRQLESLFDISKSQFIGQPRTVFMPEEIAAQHRNNDLEVIAKRQPLEFEEENLEPDGKHYYLTTKFPLFDADSNVYAVCGISTDITNRKRSEEALQKAVEEKQSLLREMQHRVKNSFTLITSLTSLMADKTQVKQARVLLAELGARVRAMAELYDLLYITEAVTETRLDEYCKKITTSFPSAENVLFEQTYEPVTVPVRTAAPLGLILTELITNAVKHAFPSGTRGTICLALQKRNQGAVIEVADDGQGFPDGFDLETSDTLGLTIIQSLMQQIHGDFRIEHGQGTRCIIEFPLKE